ncbi:MAG: TetR/AcrR family transcriptional regulator [Actinobacteria bacterium]|nr:TetR/AcrR family transcriptional regulator [Actinomycetota bacterium]
MPRLWNKTIEAHRRDVRDAVVATTARLVASEGPLSVTMSRIAEDSGIGRATLYKYFPDVESILLAWHEREVAQHLQQLSEARTRIDDADERLETVLRTYAGIVHETRAHRNGELAALLHRDDQVRRAEAELRDMISDLIADAARHGSVRDDVPPDELATFCLSALAAAEHASSKAAVRRLVATTVSGIRVPR